MKDANMPQVGPQVHGPMDTVDETSDQLKKIGFFLGATGLSLIVLAAIIHVIGNRFLTMLALFVSVLCVGTGIYILSQNFLEKRRLRLLKTKGARVFATVTSVDMYHFKKHNGRSPYIVVAQWKDVDSQKTFVVRSEPIWQSVDSKIMGEQILVYHHPNNPLNNCLGIETFLNHGKALHATQTA